MLRLSRSVRSLTRGEIGWALDLCAAAGGACVFPAARMLEFGATSRYGEVLVHEREDGAGLLWAGANVVPMVMTEADVVPFAQRLRRARSYCSSLFGPAQHVLPLWDQLRPAWGEPRDLRRCQPLLTATGPSEVEPDPLVRRAEPGELDLVVPAAAAMFTEEIGYPPYTSDARAYREAVRGIIEGGRSFVRIENSRVIFKADVGSVACGVAQIQGVWVAPEFRGRGIAAPAMEAVTRAVLRDIAPEANLYVNDYNTPARRTYGRIGYRQTGTFATVLL